MPHQLNKWLEMIGITHQSQIFHNPSRSDLITQALINNEGMLTYDGALRVLTDPYTGRSPNDKYIVNHQNRSDLWWGDVNQQISPKLFEQLKKRMTAYLNNRTLYVVDCFIGADPNYRLSVRVVSELAWLALASQNMFIYNNQVHDNEPDLTLIAAPGFHTQPEIDKVRSKAAICIDLSEKFILVAGSMYGGEVKKSAFTVMNALLPDSGVFPMHCSANVGEKGDVALYFGLSGTGKTTLSSTPDRKLVGDDEHGWGDNGVFNFEGGCYAKTIRLKPDLEPVIWKAANQYGSILENVVISEDQQIPDFDDATYTENTRASYSLEKVDNIMPDGMAGHPTNVFFLTADAFGVMPPIAKLTQDQAVYYFLSGYTSKVAGTERGLGQMPSATFSTGFAEPFLPLTPDIYAELLKKKIREHNTNIWLINTGWTGGDFNSGYRMPLPHTRRMVNWILNGEHINATFHTDPVFQIAVPDQIKGIPEDMLFPERTWEDSNAFWNIAKKLQSDFIQNAKRFEAYLNKAA
ncbi:MAG: phosphoenolpyruvate carboxykinase (ATP) [Chloroflexota bacterium]|nr:phosphoenolpyruvate carboxykinase (ATP) [Chloroflexota bacterium]